MVKGTVSGGSSSSGTKQVKEEEDVALASKGQRWRKKDISKIKCFRYGELGHYGTQCPLRKMDKEEKQNKQAASAEINKMSSILVEEFAMIIELPIAVRWGDFEL